MHHLSRRSVLTVLSVLVAITPLRALLAAENLPPEPENRVALSGYDPVSYFTDGRPEKGSAEFSADFDDATYWFRNAEHRAMFVADPDRYAPQFAGFCAVTVARGEKAEADPHAWTISDGKLYVFRGPQGVDMFRQQTAGIVHGANANWPGLRVNR
jgi:hypothetical protein